MKKVHDYTYHYRGYWDDGGVCRIRIYQSEDQVPVVICSQLPENKNTSVTNMAEYLAVEIIEHHDLPTPLTWIEHYPEHEGEMGEYSLVQFSDWTIREVCLGGAWRSRIGRPRWFYLTSRAVGQLMDSRLHIAEHDLVVFGAQK